MNVQGIWDKTHDVIFCHRPEGWAYNKFACGTVVNWPVIEMSLSSAFAIDARESYTTFQQRTRHSGTIYFCSGGLP